MDSKFLRAKLSFTGMTLSDCKKMGSIFNSNGVALILTLWVTVLLTIIASSFARMARTEVQIVSNFRDETKAYYFARGGFQQAILALMKQVKTTSRPDQEFTGEWWNIDGTPNTVSFNGGEAEIEVIDEGGKIDINIAMRDDLTRVFVAYGLEGSERDAIVDSILDWRDENNFHRLNGAEDDYYMSLDEPYEAKDAPFDTVDELLWVKGITPDIFYGKREDLAEYLTEDEEGEDNLAVTGLSEIFTVFSKSVKVNINAASLPVLISIPGINKTRALQIIELRKEEGFRDVTDLMKSVAGLTSGIQKFITFSSTRIFSIKSSGILDESAVLRTLRGVVKIKKKKDYDYEILYWKNV